MYLFFPGEEKQMNVASKWTPPLQVELCIRDLFLSFLTVTPLVWMGWAFWFFFFLFFSIFSLIITFFPLSR